jgi:hypothetical protein
LLDTLHGDVRPGILINATLNNIGSDTIVFVLPPDLYGIFLAVENGGKIGRYPKAKASVLNT